MCFTRLVHEPLAMVAGIMHRLVRVVLRGVNCASMAVGVFAAHWCSQAPADVLRRVHNRVPAAYGDNQVATPNIPAELKNSAYWVRQADSASSGDDSAAVQPTTLQAHAIWAVHQSSRIKLVTESGHLPDYTGDPSYTGRCDPELLLPYLLLEADSTDRNSFPDSTDRGSEA